MSTATAGRVDGPRTRRRRWFFRLIYVAYVLTLLALAERAFWWIGFGVRPLETIDVERVWDLYYAELRQSGALDAKPRAGDGRADILLLGASVLEQTAPYLRRELERRYGADRIKVYNLARSAHTSRDSYWKSLKLADKPFDLTLVYDAINDVRMNNCPPELFRDDYTHAAWFAGLEKRLAERTVSLGDIVHLKASQLIGMGEPDPEWIDYGSTIRTEGPLRENYRAIVERAHALDRPIALMSFGYYIPEDYSKEAFDRGELDYGIGSFRLAAELWGRPENVARTIDAHNRAIRGLVRDDPSILFVDQEAGLERSGRIFADPCHLTPEGCRAFVANLLPVIAPVIEGEVGPASP